MQWVAAANMLVCQTHKIQILTGDQVPRYLGGQVSRWPGDQKVIHGKPFCGIFST